MKDKSISPTISSARSMVDFGLALVKIDPY